MDHNPKARAAGVFLDRDGTVIEEVGYLNHPDRVKLLPGVAGAVKRMRRAGLRVMVATNQAGVARGYFPISMVGRVNRRVVWLLRRGGARLDAVYVCVHHPTAGKPPYRKDCNCRKPRAGMFLRGVREFGLDPRRCFVVGDKASDIEWGRRVGARAVLVLTGYGRGERALGRLRGAAKPDYVARDLREAAAWIIRRAGASPARTRQRDGRAA